MASVCFDGAGRRRVLFVAPDGVRRAIYLGKCPAAVANAIKTRVECIVAFSIAGVPFDAELAVWLRDVSGKIHAKLARVGLVAGRTDGQLEPYFSAWIEGRPNIALNTRRNLRVALQRLVEHFGPDRDIRTVTQADAVAFKTASFDNYAPATVGRTVKYARQLFRAASAVAPVNPFVGVSAPAVVNRKRMRFVEVEEIEAVLAVCPDDYWRLIVALARFGGLRVPSEVHALDWTDIDWGRAGVPGSITLWDGVEATTKRKLRTFPLYAELRPFLESRKRSSGPVVTPQLSATSYRQGMLNLIAMAHLDVWPRLWTNLRMSRETELKDKYPPHVVAEWMGHSLDVSERHYSAPTDWHYRQATEQPAARKTTRSKSPKGKKTRKTDAG